MKYEEKHYHFKTTYKKLNKKMSMSVHNKFYML